jgi:hypothetical protein
MKTPLPNFSLLFVPTITAYASGHGHSRQLPYILSSETEFFILYNVDGT